MRIADVGAGFASAAEFMQAVKVAAIDPERTDVRLGPLRAVAGDDEMHGASDPAGGFLMPIGLVTAPLGRPVLDPTQTTPITTSFPTTHVPARNDATGRNQGCAGGLVMRRQADSQEVDIARAQFDQLEFEAHLLIGAVHVSEALFGPGQEVETVIGRLVVDELASILLKEKLRGVGAGGQYLGVLNAPCKITVAKEVGQTANTIVDANLRKMVARCWAYADAIWLASQTTAPQLLACAETTRHETGLRVAGQPLHFTEFCEPLGTEGDLVLGTWSEFLEGTYQPLQQGQSIHVRYLQHERTFKFWVRNSGMPWWRSPLTPAYGGDTLSPFVTLATRGA